LNGAIVVHEFRGSQRLVGQAENVKSSNHDGADGNSSDGGGPAASPGAVSQYPVTGTL
jgi:hypothetical protein